MSTRLEKGQEILKSTLGSEYYARRSESTNEFNGPLRRLTDEYCFGEVWGDEALPPKIRSMLVIALLASMGREQELSTHLRGAINNGCRPEEIRAVMLQVAVYSGIPAGVAGTRAAETILREKKCIE